MPQTINGPFRRASSRDTVPVRRNYYTAGRRLATFGTFTGIRRRIDVGEITSDAMMQARRLATVYGHRLDRPIIYTQGVALNERLRLFRVGGSARSPAPDIARIVAPFMAAPAEAFGPKPGTANYAGVSWAGSLFRATDDSRYSALLLHAADRVCGTDTRTPSLLDPDARVEDFYFASVLFGEAFGLTGDRRYTDALALYLHDARTQQPDGLWWHCRASPFCWGRGNGFAALGFSYALASLSPSHPAQGALLKSHLRHIGALRRHQDSSGMWRQVIDEPRSYLEHSATAMIGCAVARGVRLGWLPGEWKDTAERAWQAVSQRTDPQGRLEHVCVGTGPQPDLQAYLERPFTDGQDDRGGAMALSFAVEMAAPGDGQEGE